jgi:TPR repeat protein
MKTRRHPSVSTILISTVLLICGCVSTAQADCAAAQEKLERGDIDIEAADVTPLAEAGCSAAQTILGLMYETGIGVPFDPHAAAGHYRAAAGNGDPQAAFRLGMLYINGGDDGGTLADGARLLAIAVDHKIAHAQYEFGKLLMRGLGVDKDEKQGLKLIQLAADQKDPEAMLDIGLRRIFGNGFPKDRETGELLLRQSADAGLAKGQYELAIMLAHDNLSDLDVYPGPEAIRFMLMAANQGFADAYSLLGTTAMTPRKDEAADPIEAAKWWILSEKSDSLLRPSLAALEKLLASMTDSQREEVSNRVAAWQTHPTKATLRLP